MTDSPALTFSVPGKTFLVGEYLALDGGPSLILATEPRFVLRASRRRSFEQNPSHPFAFSSPAERLFRRHEASFDGWSFKFEDPYEGAGGLGASSAQFLLLYSWLLDVRVGELAAFDWRRLLEEYRLCSWNGEGRPPSGADVVAQAVGGVCEFDGRESAARRLEWRFARLSFTLLRTGVKLATHEHLKNVAPAPRELLHSTVEEGQRAFTEGNEDALVAAVDRYARILATAGLTAESTLGLLEVLKTEVKAVRAAKGCGAMGADVILVLHDRRHAAEIQDWARTKGLAICGAEAQLAKRGLEIS